MIYKTAFQFLILKAISQQKPDLLPPNIITDPLPITIVEGNYFSFSVIANGSTPLHYQWFKNGVEIEGANSAAYSAIALLSDNGAAYSCSVTNAVDTVMSDTATLTVTASEGESIVALQLQDGSVLQFLNNSIFQLNG